MAMALAERDRTLAGVGWMLLSTGAFVAVTGIVRHLGSDMPAVQAAFIRYAFGALMMLPTLIALVARPPRASRVGLHAARGFVHAFGVMLWFYAMQRIPIAEVTAIGYTAPIFVTIGAAIFLGEKLALRRIIAVLAAFAGAIVILRPGLNEVSSGQLAQLGAAPLFAASYLMAKKFTSAEDSGVIVAMLSLFVMLTLLPLAIASWRPPTGTELAWLALTAAFATAGHYFLTRAFEAAPITVTQPVQFLQLVWATLLGMAAFGEPLDPWVLAGGGIIVASATYISHREAALARRERTPPAQATKL